MWFEKEVFSHYKNHLSATFSYCVSLSSQKTPQYDFLPQVKVLKEYLPENMTEYLLNAHYHLVEKRCHNRL